MPILSYNAATTYLSYIAEVLTLKYSSRIAVVGLLLVVDLHLICNDINGGRCRCHETHTLIPFSLYRVWVTGDCYSSHIRWRGSRSPKTPWKLTTRCLGWLIQNKSTSYLGVLGLGDSEIQPLLICNSRGSYQG